MNRIFSLCFLLKIACVPALFQVPHPRFEIDPDPWQEFRYSTELDTGYWMFWTPNDETQTITFEVHVEALGYVGFGMSPNGGMAGADVVIGWVLDDGTAVFHDRHALGEYEPLIDDSQDVTLLAATQNDTHTILRFSRPYVTCDGDDMGITSDTVRVIYSFTNTDPEDITGLAYHGSNKGAKSVILLSYNDDGNSIPDDAVSMEILVTNHTVPKKRTTYWCETLQVPQLDQKHHVVMFEPVIHPGNEGLVHHMLLYACQGELNSTGEGWDCFEDWMPVQQQCLTPMFVWAIGGNAFHFPNHTGIPIFTQGANTPIYMRIEVHYDNPQEREGVTDMSGFRIYVTPTLREHDIGVLIVGLTTYDTVMIPPHYDALTYRGHCNPECLQAGNTTTDDREMNVFAVYQHSHLLGRKMKTRLYRDGSEIEPLLNDENYDFDYQESRKLKNERIVYPSDLVVLDCGYQSTEKDIFTLGGYETTDEMCESFLYYYPAHDVMYCVSTPSYYQSLQVVDGIQVEPLREPPYFRITAPPEYVNKTALEVMETLDWTDGTLRDRYQQVILEENTRMGQYCTKTDGTNPLLPVAMSPELGDDWIDPDDGQCGYSGSVSRALSVLTVILSFTIQMLCTFGDK